MYSNYYRRHQTAPRTGYRPAVEAPTGALSFTLHQESVGTVVPDGTVLNSPVSSSDSWLFDSYGRKIPGTWFRSLGVKAAFMNREMLDDFDWFDAPVGWRVYGSRAELEKKFSGHNVTFVDAAEQQRRREEQKVRKAEQAVRDEQARAERAAARAEHNALIEKLTAGMVRVTGDFAVTAEQAAVASWSEGSDYSNLYPAVAKHDGSPAYRLSYGGYDDWRADCYVSPAARDAYYFGLLVEDAAKRDASVPEKERMSQAIQQSQDFLARYAGCYGADYHQWVVNRFIGQQVVRTPLTETV